MKPYRLLLLSAVLPALWGCASFNSGDILVERGTARAMLADKSITPFSEIEVYWQNFPYRSAIDSIGEGSTRPRKQLPRPVEPEEAAALRSRAKEIFAEAGLYDKARGSGTLRLELTTLGRWTYRDLFHSYLVDTGFIFIIPSSLQVKYLLTADFAVPSGTLRVETEARNKTTFHILMAPLYPFFSPGAREHGLLKQMLWRSATDVYARLKESGGAPLRLPPKQERAATVSPAVSVPPLQPDRTWLPGQPAESAPPASPDPEVTPQKPDQTWVVSPAPGQAPAAVREKAPPSTRRPAPAASQTTPAAAPAQNESPDD